MPFRMEDKNIGPPNLDDIRKANAFLHNLKLQEPPVVGRRFSWTNGQAEPIWVKLDRFIVNSDCASMFPKMIHNSLPRLGSDHVPIRLERIIALVLGPLDTKWLGPRWRALRT